MTAIEKVRDLKSFLALEKEWNSLVREAKMILFFFGTSGSNAGGRHTSRREFTCFMIQKE